MFAYKLSGCGFESHCCHYFTSFIKMQNFCVPGGHTHMRVRMHTHTHTHTHLFSWKSTFLSLFKACKAILPPALPESCWGVLIYGINICRNTWLHHEGAKAERENKSIQSKIENITQKTKILLSQQYPMMIKDKLNLKVPIQQ